MEAMFRRWYRAAENLIILGIVLFILMFVISGIAEIFGGR